MAKLKTGQYIYKMLIPVAVLYSKRDDGTVSIDCVNIPSESDIYKLVDKHAKNIKAGAKIRIQND